nr:LacI family DNA-binding transcriptional regulator [Streptomyces sp. 846.5]
MAQVAREAGVSVPTVSKVLNGREDVAAKTRRHVEEVLLRLGYQRRGLDNRPATGQRARTVDLIVHSLDTTWTGEILAGAEGAVQEAGLHLAVNAMLGRTWHNRATRGWLDRIAARGTAGVVTNLAHVSASELAWFEQNAIPYVMIDPAAAPPPQAYSVATTNWEGARSGVQHLLDLGHRRIALIAGRRSRYCSELRVEGYRSAMRAAHVRIPPSYIRHGDFDGQVAGEQMHALLDLPEPPTAVFVCSDPMALGALRSIRERGLSVPHDISVVGFDDLPESRWAVPELTTVRQPLAEMGAEAIRTLVRIMDGEAPDNRRIELSTRLMVRASTAPVAAGTTDA